ncbi:multiubiquitin domain-containing protein [Stieleria sp. TO1_6]|uniref:multiubiquitin domain-containing protein n=1 Tax=Stieleria tagensis TaxID=2956795 RepID=UPI00209BB539|nr:multiubiquitin domain-containing protein [Stieleria tagensis]MCO8123383.1 multiubiquitin domain-containing protein [Stieleria tagensis]
MKKFQLACNGLEFQRYSIPDPVPTGRQILEAAGLLPAKNYTLLAILPGSDFEDVRLKETFDLRARGVERFVAFEGDRVFRFCLNDRQLSWGLPAIQGDQLYQLADLPDGHGVFRDLPGGTDELIDPAESIDLTESGVEQFIVAPKPVSYQIFVNTRPHIVTDSAITYEELVQLAHPGANDPNVLYTITYLQAATQPPAGDLHSGCTLHIKQGTRINVTPTVQS